MSNSDDQLLTLQEAASLIGCCTKTLYRLMNDGLPYLRGEDGRRYLKERHILHLLRSATPRNNANEATISSLQAQIVRLQEITEQQSTLIASVVLKLDQLNGDLRSKAAAICQTQIIR